MEVAEAKGTERRDVSVGKGRQIGKGREEGGSEEEEEEGEVRLGVTCANEIRPPHSILTDRPGEGSAKPPETHTSLHHSPLPLSHFH